MFNLKFNPCRIIGFIDAEGRIIVIIIGNSKLQHRLVVLVYFSSLKTRPPKILIRRSTIVVLPNAPELQNSIILLHNTARNYSTVATTPRLGSVENLNLNPNWVTGFVDGEGCFHISISERKGRKFGWQVSLHFQIGLHVKDKAVLDAIKEHLYVGEIGKQGSFAIQLQVQSIKEFQVLLEHFDKYPLITTKKADYKALKLAYFIIKKKEHLTKEGFRKIIAIRASMNRGLSQKLEVAFPDYVPVKRPIVELPQTIDPHWLAGFTSGEGCFLVIVERSTTKIGWGVKLVFQLTQHSRDYELLKMIIIYLGCGYVIKDRDSYNFRVTKHDDIVEKIIPYFKKYKIHGVKSLDFADFSLVAELMKQKKHLTAEGLYQIRKIKAGMNRGRKRD